MEYSKKTAQLLERMDNVALRQKYVFNKEKITELVEKSYKLFNLEIPKIKWCVDITDKKFLEAAGAAWAARAARAARVAGAARVAWAAWAAWAASDYDGQEFIFTFEYSQTDEINENDRKFLDAQELFLQAKEAGMGYWAEGKGIVYICPNPIILFILLNDELRYHSEIKPAISWKNGLELFYLNGINFEKSLWQKITSKTLPVKEAIKLKNTDQRSFALKYLGWDKVLKELGARVINKEERGLGSFLEKGELLEIDLKDDTKPARFIKGIDPAKGEPVIIRVKPDTQTFEEGERQSYRLELVNLKYEPDLRV